MQTLFYFQCHWPFLSGIKDILLHTPFSGRSTKRLVPEPRGHCGPEGVREGQEKTGRAGGSGGSFALPEIVFKKRFALRELLLVGVEGEP